MNELDDAAKAVNRLDAAVNQGLEPIPRESVEIPDEKAELALVDPEFRQPWDRIEGESDYEYEMFVRYRDMGLGRTVMSVFRSVVDERTNNRGGRRTQNRLYTASTKYRWKDRAYQWDQYEEMQYQLARSESMRSMVSRHEEARVDAIDSLMTPVKALQRRMDDDPDFLDNLSKASAAKLIDMANKASRTIPSLMNAERLARGMPTEVVGGTVEHQLVTTVDRDQIGEILEVLDQAGVLNVGGGDLDTGEVVDAEVVEFHPLPADGDDE